jgi:V/A-type H+-transporting ATPase subunit E
MSLDTVVEDIRDEARAHAEEVRSDAESQAADIVAEAASDAEEIVAEAEREAERTVEQEREQTLSSAKLEAKQARLEARRELLADVREDVESAVAGLSGNRREELTRALLDTASEEFEDSDRVQVYGAASDEALLEDVLADYEGFSYAGEYDCLGGVIVESEGSRVRVNNTFDSVLEEVWEENLRDISDELFQ